MSKNYTIFHLHSDLSNAYTTADSVTKFKEYVNFAKENGMKALGFSEHGNVLEWFHKKEAIEEAGMKYIHAIEAYITVDNCAQPDTYSATTILSLDETTKGKDKRITFSRYYEREDGMYLAVTNAFSQDKTTFKSVPIDIESLRIESYKRTKDNMHCVLIAKNDEGRKEINRLSSKSFDRKDNYHFYMRPRITLDELFATSDNIMITSACLGGLINKSSEDVQNKIIEFFAANKHRCYFEIQHHDVPDQIAYNRRLWELSKKYGVPLIAGTDTHSLSEAHAEGRLILQKSKNASYDEENGFNLTAMNYFELCDAYRNQRSLPDEVWLEAIEETNRMADKVEEFTLDRNTKYPSIYKKPLETYKHKINEAYKKHPYIRDRYKPSEINPVIQEEVKVYEKTKSIGFMLLQTYLREWEKENGIECGYGRGSVSGSEVAYVLGITQMDSKKFGLNFFRFMNPSRVTNAD